MADKLVHLQEPTDFKPAIEVVSCFLIHEDKLLLLHRQDHKPQGNTWGVPAGKIGKGEPLIDAIRREMAEEIGFAPLSDKITYFKKVFVRYPGMDFIYHMFHAEISTIPELKINSDEHKDYLWVKPADALRMNLIPGERECIEMLIHP